MSIWFWLYVCIACFLAGLEIGGSQVIDGRRPVHPLKGWELLGLLVWPVVVVLAIAAILTKTKESSHDQ